MKAVRWWAGVALMGVSLSAPADWYIVYSPVIAKHTGHSTYCCFPTRAACEEARTRYLQRNDSVGCQGFDGPAAKKAAPGGKGNAAEQQGKTEAAQKAHAAQLRKQQEEQFRKDQADTVRQLKGMEGADSGSGLQLKAAPPAGGSALGQLKNDAAWSDKAAGNPSAEQAREEAERGAQGQGGIKHLPAANVPEVPAPTRVPE